MTKPKEYQEGIMEVSKYRIGKYLNNLPYKGLFEIIVE